MSGGLYAVVPVLNVGGMGEVEASKMVELEIHEGPLAGVGKTSSTSNESISTLGEEAIGASLVLSSSSFWYYILICWM